MANREKVLKLLRNDTLFGTREQALSYINTMAQTLGDGEFWASTYGDAPNAKSILAFKRDTGITIFDIESIGGDIIAGLSTIAKSGLASDAKTNPIASSSTSVAVEGSNAADQIASLATTLKTVQDNASKYKMVALTPQEIAALSDENVKEAYKVVSYQGDETAQTVYTQVGDTVKIYKDSSLIESYLGSDADTVDASTGVITKYAYELISNPTTKVTKEVYDALSTEDKALYQPINSQSLNFVYQLVNGTYSLIKVDVSKFLAESEFKDGLEVSSSGEVSIKVDDNSDEYISVSENGLKLTGIKKALDSLQTLLNEIDLVTSAALNSLETRKADKSDLNNLSTEYNTFKNLTNQTLNDLQQNKADKSEVETLLSKVIAGNGIDVTEKQNNQQTVSVKLDTTKKDKESNALTVSENGLYFSKTIDCGEY